MTSPMRVGATTQTRAGPGSSCGRTGHKRVGSKVDVQQCALGAFSQNTLARIKLVIDPLLGIDHLNLTQALDGFEPSRLVLARGRK